MPNPNVTQLRIRLKNKVLNWLKTNALHNKRSLSAEIEYCAEQYIENVQTQKASSPIAKQTLDASTQSAIGADQ